MKSVRVTKRQLLSFAATIFSLLISIYIQAQDWNAGINEANTKVRSYFASGTNLLYAVVAIVGLIGDMVLSRYIKNGTVLITIQVKLLLPALAVVCFW